MPLKRDTYTKDVKKTFFLKGPYYTYIIFEVLEVFEK